MSALTSAADSRAVLEAEAPELFESAMLEQLVDFPALPLLRLVLGEDDPRPDSIMAKISLIPDPRLVADEEPPISVDDSYESPDVVRGSARLRISEDATTDRRVELVIDGPQHGNPFVDVDLEATFKSGETEIRVGGFYDGGGRYVVRFLPPSEGTWSFNIHSNARSLDALAGHVEVARGVGRGPVSVSGTHFVTSDGSPFVPLGTTAYAWTHQEESLQEDTLATLATAPFNKLRMCLFPKHFIYNVNEPAHFVWAKTPNGFDTTRFDIDYWHDLEKRVDQLAELGIEADLILFHPYDRWGFSTQSRAADDRYVTYLTRRLSSFSNVWWSMANEYDLMLSKETEDWDRLAELVLRNDAVGHPISIHNWIEIWNYSSPWATHCSIQQGDRLGSNVDTWRKRWNKPVVIDECGYEGNLDQGWGSLTGEEFTRRAWEIALHGGYVTHGETFYRPDDVIWWSKGGSLRGESPEHLRFLADIASQSPSGRIDALPSEFDSSWGGVAGEYIIIYFGAGRPIFRDVVIPAGMNAKIDVIDTWNMTLEPVAGVHSGTVRIDLPARPYCAIRLQRANEAH